MSGGAIQYRILLVVLGMLLYLPFLGMAPLFDWDEVNFAESAREMLVTGDFFRVQVNFQPFWEKPPLFIWMQAASMKIFGINEYAARLPNAIFGIINLLILFEIGKKMRSERFGLLIALFMGGSFLPHVYFKSGIIDPVFNTFIFLSIWNISNAAWNYGNKSARSFSLKAGVFLGLAILTKGPVALLLAGLTTIIFWMVNRFKPIVNWQNLLITTISVFLVSSLWFGVETIKNGPWFLEEFIDYQIRLFSTPDAGHKQPIYYHFVVVFLGCFPMSFIALKALFRNPQFRIENHDLQLWMKILFWVVLILFSITTTKIVHYSSMAYLPLSFIAAMSAEEYLRGRQNWKLWQGLALFIPEIIIGLAMLALPIIGSNTEALIPYIKDKFAVGNLQANVEWGFIDFIPGILWITSVIIGFFYLTKGIYRSSIVILLSGCILSTSIFLALFPNKIAGYTQQAAVDFYKEHQSEDVYIETIGFKSYAQYFYFQKAGLSKSEVKNNKGKDGRYHIDALREWLLHGDIDKPAYFVSKNIHKEEFEKIEELKVIGEKNGFVFYKRYP